MCENGDAPEKGTDSTEIEKTVTVQVPAEVVAEAADEFAYARENLEEKMGQEVQFLDYLADRLNLTVEYVVVDSR